MTCNPECWTPIRCPSCGNEIPPRGRSVPLGMPVPACCDRASVDPDVNPRHLWSEDEAADATGLGWVE